MISILLLGPTKWERATHSPAPSELLARAGKDGVKNRPEGAWPIDEPDGERKPPISMRG
jgi:hypothetical protein